MSLITILGLDPDVSDSVRGSRWNRNVELAKQMLQEGIDSGEITLIEVAVPQDDQDPLDGFKWVK